jgi:hypothetical protein
MSQKYEKLKALLKELFQLDQPDLDFGLYRIMHAKSAEVSQFLDRDLLPQVQAAFGHYKTAEKAEIEKDLAKVIAGIEAAGMDPAQSPKVNDLRARLKSDAVDVGALESEVYDRLFSFFRRYYSEGDFLAKRVYKPGVYAIPYEGEEVTLHWANKDQYYIKTSEYLRDYAFRLRPEDPSTGSGQAQNPMRVHFRLADAAEGEHGNVKAAEGKDRVFILATENFIALKTPSPLAGEGGGEGDELEIRFEYRPATLTDWPEETRAGKSKPPAQKDLSALAVKRLLAVTDATVAPWITELGKPHFNVQAFTDPTAYKLKVKRPGSDESREVNVDLLETFNWLIGLTVRHIAAPQIFSAAFERDSEKRLRLSSKTGGRLKQEAAGPYWFRTVTGTTPDGRRTLVIWRKLTGEPEQDNLVLDEWFTKQGYSAKDSEFDLIYVNGGNNLENLKTPDDLWKVRLIEEDFHRLMFETEGV